MNSISKKSSLIILAITSIVFSRLMFVFFDDPEGTNLLVTTVMAAIVYALTLAAYKFIPSATLQKKLLLTIFIQIAIVAGLWLVLK